MFAKSLDNKSTVTDAKGNTIVDLTTSIFNDNAGNIRSYTVKKMSSYFEMRPDLVAIHEYGTQDHTEFILKYSGISNPFSLKDDDILMIPDETMADAQTQGKTVTTSSSAETKAAQVRNFYKFANTKFSNDTTSYEELKNKTIPSGIKNSSMITGNYSVPYISDDGTTSITIKNGRMYFGTDAGFDVADVIKASTTDVDQKIQAIIDATNTALSDTNCMYNGTNLANFVRTTITSNFANGNNEES